jgi:hypothetical protein
MRRNKKAQLDEQTPMNTKPKIPDERQSSYAYVRAGANPSKFSTTSSFGCYRRIAKNRPLQFHRVKDYPL